MPDELLTVFKLCFLALLYLFFFRALRAVWTEVNTPVATPARGEVPAPAKAQRLTRSERRAAARPPKAPAVAAAATPTPSRPTATSSAAPTRLVAVEPPQLAGIEYTLGDGLTIGRSEAATIMLDDSFLSGRHASFLQRDGVWVVEDLGSTNGTYVNRTKVDRIARLSIGDSVQAGNVVLEVR